MINLLNKTFAVFAEYKFKEVTKNMRNHKLIIMYIHT